MINLTIYVLLSFRKRIMSYKVISDNLICATEEVKIQLNLETAKLENLSPANCLSKGQLCPFYRLLPLSINLNGTKINGDVWFHGGHNDSYPYTSDAIRFGVTWYSTKSFVMNVDLQLEYQSSKASIEKRNLYSLFSEDTTKLDKCSTSITLHSEHATLKVVLIGSHRSTSIVSICSDDRFLCQ